MKETLLDLRFKGERDYLHGTDMFNETVGLLQSASNGHLLRDIDFSIHHIARSQLKLTMQAIEGVEAAAICTYAGNEGRQRAYLFETGQPVIERYPYPEDEIVASMEVDMASRRGILKDQPPYSNIEVWVAMTKALHYKVFPELSGKWMFVRCRMPDYTRQTTAAEHMLVIASLFNNRLTRSEVLLDGTKAADLFFSIV